MSLQAARCNTPAFLVLYFANSAELASFSLMTFSTEGERLSGRGIDGLVRTVEYALLRAAETDRVPVVGWTLLSSIHC